ncbi:hypothetical protein C8N24_2725 [Solirubrobacter pauli]|uniref:DUF2304 domain-containing protein n=1 Tax=Solirubrobacter pauli TaxID=166793 RepID=A0A660LE63_9ACTN|nr:DUF2304 domain-containing protein [Solirubrobacter pauli]RKQ92869.1 hypothetical protein C8N24_2725 [Solirubrobacter pauli]
MDNRIQIVAIIATAVGFAVVFELVRRRRLLERYALLWLLSAAVMLGLSIWRGALEEAAGLIGVAYPPSALFVIAFGFVLLMLLHYSLVISRIVDENKRLAQRLGLLQQKVDALVAEQRTEEPREVEALPGPRT